MDEYTKGSYTILPTDTSSLTNTYSSQDYLDVATIDSARVNQDATNQYAIHQFKNFASVATSCIINFVGQTTLYPGDSTVYLQIYNFNTASWETVDQMPITYNYALAAYGDSNRYYDSVGINTDFTFQTSISNLTNYKDGSYMIYCRVYQLSI